MKVGIVKGGTLTKNHVIIFGEGWILCLPTYSIVEHPSQLIKASLNNSPTILSLASELCYGSAAY
jgi:hypothetical protein